MFIPGIYIFDIDGTLADNDHRAHFLHPEDHSLAKDWDSFFAAQHLDTPIIPIVTILRALNPFYRIVLLTGRGQEWSEVTHTWLDKHGIPCDQLIMRPLKCRENDSTLKIRLINENFNDDEKAAIMTIFEDRGRVINSLRAEGYHVCDVAGNTF